MIEFVSFKKNILFFTLKRILKKDDLFDETINSITDFVEDYLNENFSQIFLKEKSTKLKRNISVNDEEIV